MICERCGHQNSGDANFCSSCGEALSGSAQPTLNLPRVESSDSSEDHRDGVTLSDLIDHSSLGDTGCALVIRSGPGEGSTFILGSDRTTIGRHPDSEVFLDDITVSRRHAEVTRDEGGCTVHDVGSLNGTYVNRERVEQSKLRDGDELQVGRFKLVLCCRASEESR